MRSLILALALVLLVPTAALAQHHRDGGGWHPGGGNNWHPNNGGWHHGPNAGGIGNVIGGIIVGNAISNWIFGPPRVVVQEPVPVPVPEIVPGTPAWYAYCANKYRSFNPQTGTYLGYDGVQHPCQ